MKVFVVDNKTWRMHEAKDNNINKTLNYLIWNIKPIEK